MAKLLCPGFVDLFHYDSAGTNGAFITVTITYTGAPSGTTNIYVAGALEYTESGNYPMSPATPQIRIGSALHSPIEGLDATIKNIFITTYDSGTGCPSVTTLLPTTFPSYVPTYPTTIPSKYTLFPNLALPILLTHLIT